MQRTAVIGLGWGDEGKGVVTDWLCSKNPSAVVVRFSGGHQCAHTVFHEKINHVFSNFGSGTLRGISTYWSAYCTFDPVGFYREYCILKSKGITPTIYIHGSCQVTTPYDIRANWHSKEMTYGTTGVGFWKTIERNQKGVTLTVAGIFQNTNIYLNEKMRNIEKYYTSYKGWAVSLSDFYDSVKQIKNGLDGTIFIETSYPKTTECSFIFEGSQGLLLDKDSVFFPHVTPSKTDLTNIFKMGYDLDDVYLVTRAYQTRHGAGPITNEELPLRIQEMPDEYTRSTKYNYFQGNLRKTVLDLDLLKYGMDRSVSSTCKDRKIVKHLVVTCLDQIQGLFTLTHNKEVKEFTNEVDFVQYIANVLEIDGCCYGNHSPYTKTIRQIV